MRRTATIKKKRTGTMPERQWYTSQEGVAAADKTFGPVKYTKKSDAEK